MKQEIELKYQLAHETDFRHLMSVLKKQAAGHVTVLEQKNTFFDTSALDLKKKGLSLRLRRQNGQYLLCAKQSSQKTKLNPNLSQRLEYEAELKASTARLVEQQLLSPLDAFLDLPASSTEDLITKEELSHSLTLASSYPLQIIGSFKNKRTAIPVKLSGNLLCFELDHSIYPDGNHIFECEIEFCSADEASSLQPVVEHMIKEIGIRTQASIAKSARLYRILGG